MSALLEVSALSKRFGGVQAVADLSFTVQEGEILALIGPNGAGKSTVFNLINGVFRADSGRIVFAGVNITGEPTYEIAHHGIARAHQIVQPLAGLSVLDNCLVGACYCHDNLSMSAGRAVVREVAALVGLSDRLAMPAGQLTTAGKKRLELARALCGRPRLLLLDEVLAGLNPTEIEGMIEVIRAIRARGVAILIIEHVMRAIMSLSDRVVALNLGRNLAEGSPRQIVDNPAVIEAYLGDPKLMNMSGSEPMPAPKPIPAAEPS
jgi:branched-chain amino acid transport system ATP-binding protein